MFLLCNVKLKSCSSRATILTCRLELILIINLIFQSEYDIFIHFPAVCEAKIHYLTWQARSSCWDCWCVKTPGTVERRL